MSWYYSLCNFLGKRFKGLDFAGRGQILPFSLIETLVLTVTQCCATAPPAGINITSCVGGRLNIPPPPQVDLWPFDLESGVRVTCDVGYVCANFSLPRPLCSRLSPDVRDRQTDVRQTNVRHTSDAHHRLVRPALGAGHNNQLSGLIWAE